MNIPRTKHFLLTLVFLLTACAKQAQATPATALPIATITSPTETPTEIPTAIPSPTLSPIATTDSTIFGVIGQNEIQAFALESVANAIFSKTLDGFIADGKIREYQVMHVTVFPGSNGLLSEIIFNVRTTDSAWLENDGTPAIDNWINNKCYRFDFVTTETEFQLKNRRTCN